MSFFREKCSLFQYTRRIRLSVFGNDRSWQELDLNDVHQISNHESDLESGHKNDCARIMDLDSANK